MTKTTFDVSDPESHEALKSAIEAVEGVADWVEDSEDFWTVQGALSVLSGLLDDEEHDD